jgi:Undecaprenyl-phosphate glucose phosphotransferase
VHDLHAISDPSAGTGFAASGCIAQVKESTDPSATACFVKAEPGPSKNPLFPRRAFVGLVQAFDALVIVFTAIIALALMVYRVPNAGPSMPICVLISLFVTVIVQCVFAVCGLYEFSAFMRWRLGLAAAAFAWFIATGPIVTVALIHDPSGAYARRWVLAWFVGGLVTISGSRPLIAFVGMRLRRAGLLGDRICIIGSSASAAACLEQVRGDANGASVLGYFDDFDANDGSGLPAIPRLGSLDEAPSLLQHHRADAVIVALPMEQHARIAAVVRRLQRLPIRVLLAPWLIGADQPRLTPRGVKSEIGNMVLVPLANPPLSGWSWICKDLQDRTIALLVVVLCAPVLVAVSLAIWLTDGKPVLFRQHRQGYGGRAFQIFKFRTMSNAASTESERDLKLTTRDDPRIFPVGRFLRRTSLDELPQLFNVIRGDMWIVGPRPHSPLATAAGKIYAEAVDDYPSRHRIKPGITGWAQVNGWRGPTDTLDQIINRVEHDLFYIENWSVLFDLRILFRTVLCVFSHDNAF